MSKEILEIATNMKNIQKSKKWRKILFCNIDLRYLSEIY